MHSAVQAALIRGDAWVRLELWHPKGNIITAEMIAGLRAALRDASANRHLKLLTIEGRGADFSFGASIPEHTADVIADVLPEMHLLVQELLAYPAPTAAVVRGRCLGGGFEIALACDAIFAADDAVLGLPEIALGVFPPAAAALLPWRVGLARATRAVLTGEARSAREWLDAGLITKVAPADDLQHEVERWFDAHFAVRSAVALRHAAAAVRLSLVQHVKHILPELERIYLGQLMQTRDAVEGIAAFLEKRPPRWTDE